MISNKLWKVGVLHQLRNKKLCIKEVTGMIIWEKYNFNSYRYRENLPNARIWDSENEVVYYYLENRKIDIMIQPFEDFNEKGTI